MREHAVWLIFLAAVRDVVRLTASVHQRPLSTTPGRLVQRLLDGLFEC